jgi:heme/copper-type cytochrome/quinol oxidase subunit 1
MLFFTSTYSLLLWPTLVWLKARILYIANNWIYTTNHKRIAVNYFFFVKFAGIVGSVLATIIRLEMAYPGVGILAGDSLQYLSVVTAHAVVMVFFMIMPLMFGAFANFLLPTQLGVHDVAFPRLNSAAFWFLPAGLIMLCQLVCLDRRYQRMNCFNIREIQSILKGRHFSDNVSIHEFHDYIDNTVISLRFKNNNISTNKPKILLFFENGIINFKVINDEFYLPKVENQLSGFTFLKSTSFTTTLLKFVDNYCPSVIGMFATGSLNSSVFNLSNMFHYSELTFFTNILNLSLDSLNNKLTNIFSINSFTSTRSSSFNNKGFSFWTFANDYVNLVIDNCSFKNVQLLNYRNFFCITTYTNLMGLRDVQFLTLELLRPTWTYNNSLFDEKFVSFYTTTFYKNWVALDLKNLMLGNDGEIATNFRDQKSQIMVFKYNYKVGDYCSKAYRIMYPSMFNTISQITGGVRRSAWFFSDTFSELFEENFNNYIESFNFNRLSEKSPELVYFGNTNGFFNFFNTLVDSENFINQRWVSVNAIDQKFYRMFSTSTMQERIYNNWRQLKFTREAWRCKLLAARHQKTLYRRYLNEDGVIWMVEKNARDVLPGWAMITPFSARTKFTAIGKVDIGLMGVFLVLNSSIVSSANFLVTYRYLSTLNNRKMRDARSFFTEGVMVASWMMIAANPMLAIGILMLLSDRHWQTSFFDYSGGGDTVLFQHMFWFFGHPEVYVIMIPAFGFNNTILSFYLRKRVSARASLMYSMYTIAFLGFFVWGHHMYMVGLAHTTRMLFSTLTVMISVPAATKLMHWCVTLVNSSFWVELPFLFTLLFIFFFVSGGISGMAVAHTGMDILFHDSFYVIGHFHVMFAGAAMFASFGAFYFYFPSIFGVKFSRIWGYLHITYFLLGQLMTVIPMFWLGYSGMPRRILDYPASLGGWHAIVSAGHLLSIAGLMAFFIMIFDSLRQGRAATRNSFGISRFNTRFNFYLYEIARTRFVQRKGWYVSRYNRTDSLSLNKLNYVNHELLETSLYSYTFVKTK